MMFLLGLVAGKLNVIHRLDALELPLIHLAMLPFPMALMLKAVYCLPVRGLTSTIEVIPFQSLVLSIAGFISIPILTLVYLIELAMMLRRISAKTLTPIACAGKMSLTNYLMQILICVFLFYGFAGGLAGNLTILQTMATALLIYVFQLLFSTIWLRFYAAGPVESAIRVWAQPPPDPTQSKVRKVG